MHPLPTEDFMPRRFVSDIEETASAIGAPFSREVTRRMLDTYAEGFATGAVLWKTTSRPGDALSYRFYSRRRWDTMGIATRAGLVTPGSPLSELVTSWSGLNDGQPVQSCDFDADSGLAKAWVFLGATVPLSEVLGAQGVPQRVLDLAPTLREHGLERVRYTAVDFRHSTVNVYFRVQGPFSAEHLRKIAGLAHSPDADEALFEEIRARMPRKDYVAGVTISLDRGRIERVAVYAADLPKDQLPSTSSRITRFFSAAPSYDEREVNVVAWSFGPQGHYVKAERSWFGNLASLFKRADVLVSGGDQTDQALRH
jgi:4-hydroxyphenylpyruvate 3-dimethylallyltransferase